MQVNFVVLTRVVGGDRAVLRVHKHSAAAVYKFNDSAPICFRTYEVLNGSLDNDSNLFIIYLALSIERQDFLTNDCRLHCYTLPPPESLVVWCKVLYTFDAVGRPPKYLILVSHCLLFFSANCVKIICWLLLLLLFK